MTTQEPDFYGRSEVPAPWKLTPAQAAFVDCAEPYIKLVGGRASGKTYAGAAKAIRYALGNPGSMGIAFASDYAHLIDSLVPTFFRLLDNRQVQHWEAMTGSCLLTNQSLILFSHLEMLDSKRSHNLAWVWFDDAEDAAEADVSKMKVRLRQRGFPHQMWCTEYAVPVFTLDG